MASRLSTAKKLVTQATNSSNTNSSLVTNTGNTTKTNSTTTNNTSIASLVESQISNNVLDSYQNVTYHIRLSMSYEGNETIIVESGKSDLIIDSFEIDSTIGTDFRVKNITTCQMRIVLREAVGVSFFDKLFYLQSLYGVDLKTIVYNMQLSFKGYDTNGRIVNNIGGSTYSWSIIMTNLDYKIDESGSIYNISFISVANTAFSNEIGVIQFGMSIDNTSGTLGSILSSLANELNTQTKNNNFGIQRVTYKFNYIPYSTLGLSIPLDISSPEGLNILSSTSTKALYDSSRNSNVSQITKGTQIIKYIEMLLSNSNDQNSLLLGKKNPSVKDMYTSNGSVYSIHHKVLATVTYGDFNPIINDYQKTVTYTIIPKITHTTIQSISQIKTDDNSHLNWSKNKIQSVIYNSNFARKYDYIFTGLNTEVYDFSIKGNMTYALNFPSFFGMNTSISSVTTGQVNSSNSNTTSNIVSNYNSIISSPQNSLNVNQTSVSQSRKSLSQKLTTYNGKYIDDITSDSIGQLYNKIHIPVQITSEQNDQGYSGSVERGNNGSESIYSTIMNQVYYSANSELANIELSIRYDPYWLGSVNDGSTVVNMSYDTVGKYLNYDNRDMCFLFNFNVPTGFSETTNNPIIKKDNMFTGMYVVTTVKHRFGAGNMSQQLSAIRIKTAPYTALIK